VEARPSSFRRTIRAWRWWSWGSIIRADSDQARRLVECAIRRFTGNAEATPDVSPGPLPIAVQAETHWKAIVAAEGCIAECADELNIEKPPESVSVIHP
jgi:hypothetical protein